MDLDLDEAAFWLDQAQAQARHEREASYPDGPEPGDQP